MSENLEEMSAFFNKRAENYDIVHLEHVGGIEGKQILASFLPAGTKKIIDFGIGTGLELDGIFKCFPNVEITGLDISENMLQILKERYSDKNVQLFCNSYLDFDFGKEVYDVALSVMTLHHYTHEVKNDLYKRIYECIKPGGMYIENDYMLSEHEYENAQEMEEFYFSEYNRLKAEQGIIDDVEYHYDTPCTTSNQKELLYKAGFSTVEEVWRKGNSVTLIAKK